MNNIVLKCAFVPPFWLLVTNWFSWGLGTIVMVIALIALVEQIAIKENAFTKKNKIILIIMAALLIIGMATTTYLYYNSSHQIMGVDC